MMVPLVTARTRPLCSATMRIIPSPVLPPLPEAEFSELSASIRDFGVQVPVMVTEEGVLIDGHERFRACQDLGIRKFPLRVLGKLTDQERREWAVRLNVERRHLTPSQRRHLIETELKADAGRSDRALAGVFRCDHKTIGSVRRKLIATGEVPQLPRTSRNGKVFRPPAVGVESLKAADEAGRLIQALGDAALEGGISMRDLRKAAWAERYRQASTSPAGRVPTSIIIKKSDFRRLDVEDGSVDLILTDPPWTQRCDELREPMAECFSRWLKPGGLLVCYVGTHSLPSFLATFSRHLTYQWTIAGIKASKPPEPGQSWLPGGSFKSGGKFLSCWRPALLFSRGPLSGLLRAVSDVVILGGAEKDDHPWQQTLEEARYFLARLTRPGALVVDPFVGSGTNAVAVALEGQGRRFLGGDIDASCVRIARRRVSDAVKAPEAIVQTL